MNSLSNRKLNGISAVFPAYNDENSIVAMVETALSSLRQVAAHYEIIVTNDGSADRTGAVLEQLCARIPELRVIHHPANRGYGAALKSGFAAARYDWIFYTDGDGQYDPGELVNLVAALRDGADVVNGYKISRSDSPARIIAGRLYHWMTCLFFGIRIRDVDCDFRLIRRRELERARLESDSGAICVEMIRKLQDQGCGFIEIPVHHYPRRFGHSQFFNLHHVLPVFGRLFELYRTLVIRRRVREEKV